MSEERVNGLVLTAIHKDVYFKYDDVIARRLRFHYAWKWLQFSYGSYSAEKLIL